MGREQLVVGHLLVGEEGGVGPQGALVHEHRGRDAVALPVGGQLGHGDVHMLRVGVVGIGQQAQLCIGDAGLDEAHAAFEPRPALVALEAYLAGEAEGRADGERLFSADVARGRGDAVLHLDVVHKQTLRLFLVVVEVVVALAGEVVATGDEQVGTGEVVVGTVAVEHHLGVVQHPHLATLADVQGVGGGSNGGVGHADQEHSLARQFADIIFIQAQQRAVSKLLAGGVGAGEAHSRHVAGLGQAQAQLQGVETLGGAASGVGQGQLLAVHLPAETVGPGLVLHQLEVAAHRSLLGLDVGTAGVVVDARADILRAEGHSLVGGAAQREAAHLGAHLTRCQGEVLRAEGALAHLGHAGGSGTLGHQVHTPLQRGIAAVHLEGPSAVDRGHGHRVGVGMPVHAGLAVGNLREALLLAHVEGVGDGHRGVEQEEVVFRFGVRRQVVQRAVAAQTAVVQLELLAVLAFAAVGGIAALRGLHGESQVVVLLHAQRLLDVREDAARGEHAVELQAVDDEVHHAVDGEGQQGIVEPVAHILAALDVLGVIEHFAVLQALEYGVFLVLRHAAMVVGLVHLEGAHQVAQRRAHQLLVLVGSLEVGHVELHALDVGHVEGEVLIVEVAILDGEHEFAHVDAAREVQGAVAAHDNLAARQRVGVDHHRLAVAHHEGLHATDKQRVVGKVQTGVVARGGRLEGHGVVVEALALGGGFLVVDQFVLDFHPAGVLVVGHQAVLRQRVDHQQRLAHVEADGVRQPLRCELRPVRVGVLVHPLHRALLVDAVNLAVFAVGIVVARFEARRARGAAGGQVGEHQVVLVHAPHDGLAVYVEAVVGVDVRAVEVALRVVDQHHLLLGRQVAHQDAVVGDGVLLAHIERNRGVLGRHAL